jgi:hypothetical protein
MGLIVSPSQALPTYPVYVSAALGEMQTRTVFDGKSLSLPHTICSFPFFCRGLTPLKR